MKGVQIMYDKKDYSERGRKQLFLVLDTETATLPFANEIALNEKQKKNIAIAKPLCYDIGWLIVDRDLNVYEKRSFLVSEIFCVPQVFNTAYYKDKRPIYLERLKKNETEIKMWSEIRDILFEDLGKVNFCCAFNAMFDFKKAIPFTEQYIYHLYNADYQEWEYNQRQICQSIANGNKPTNGKDFDKDNFNFKGIDFPMIDIWGVTCEKLLNTKRYKKFCLDGEMITESGKFFKTSAESAYRFILKDMSFDEAHTAIDDSIIESYLLHKALKKGKVTRGIIYFPFRQLGTTIEYLRETPSAREKDFDFVIRVIEEKMESCSDPRYSSQLESNLAYLDHLKRLRFA